jgi:hypothetical protein
MIGTGEREPVAAGREHDHIGVKLLAGFDPRVGLIPPGVGRVPHRVLGKAHPGFIAGRAAGVLKVVKDLQMPAPEGAEVA